MHTRLGLVTSLLLAVLCLGPEALAGKGGNGGGKPGGGGGSSAEAVIAFAQARKRGGFDLAATDAAGTSVTTVVASASSTWIQADWSPDGSQIAFSGTLQGSGIYVVDADGGNLAKIAATTAGSTSKVSWSPVAAPDGRSLILFDDDGGGGGIWGNADLFVVAPDGTGRTRITSTTDRTEISPVWSRDATEIACIVAYHTSGMPNDVVVLTLAFDGGVLSGGTEANVTDLEGSALRDTSIYSLDWARTDDVLAVAAVPPGGTDADLWILDLASPATPWNLTTSPGTQERTPTWSSDDSEIAYWAPGGKTKVARIASDGLSSPLTVLTGGRSPAWKR